MWFGEPHLIAGKSFSYQTEHVGTTKLKRVIVYSTLGWLRCYDSSDSVASNMWTSHKHNDESCYSENQNLPCIYKDKLKYQH